jgi:hypothetical protein
MGVKISGASKDLECKMARKMERSANNVLFYRSTCDNNEVRLCLEDASSGQTNETVVCWPYCETV